ncbi:hypothetical protein CI610_00159 [invertebrate metagenome]|uniref:Trans-aconitate 2-methyltransferase n=1 Tax=invertebrate metagenome TaxID=1711999 RepID=A0A2H9TC42_9ZZZZ
MNSSLQDGNNAQNFECDDRIHIFDAYSDDYNQWFSTFLAHTDQKEQAMKWLRDTLGKISDKRYFIDVGAGNGLLTRQLSDYFMHIEAVEPNPYLYQLLTQVLPDCTSHLCAIMDATPDYRADFILCSHVLYYIPLDQWLKHIKKMVEWLSSDGTLVIALQAQDTGCMQLYRHFTGHSFNLMQLVEPFNTAEDLEIAVERVPASIITNDLATTYRITEFVLNLLPLENPPLKADVYRYIENFFKQKSSKFVMSCDQLFLKIHRNS